jgi:predicted ATPase/DNA-binding SARP family transcriptional activator
MYSEKTTKLKLVSERTTPLSIRLFGPMEVLVHGEPLPHLRSRKGQWLLAHLALRAGTPVDRSWLAGVLWPESLDTQARMNLRQSLADLRRALGREAGRLKVEGSQKVWLDLEGCDLDTASFDALALRSDRESLGAAVLLYRGPLLQESDDEYFRHEQQAREQAAIDLLEILARMDMESSDFISAAGWLRRLIAIDPFRESAVRTLMEAHAAQGDYAGVTMAWRQLRERLRDELRQEPSAETTACFRALRAQAGSPRPQLEAIDSKHAEERLPPPGHPGRLPSPLTQLVGRKEAVMEVCSRLSRSRMVTLTGSGGVGKTRLAIRAAWESLDSFEEGVRFVELAGISDPDLVAQAVALTLDVRETPGQAITETLAAAIGGRSLLLLIDNCEHLLEACARLADHLAARCPKLRILATSRQPLGITGEAVWRVPSLSVPGDGLQAVERLLEYESVRLFAARAADAQPGFELSPDNMAAVTQICRRLDGIPLALELAAARMRALTVEQIAERLDRRFDLLSRGSRAALPRQQTLRALVDWSYDLLTEGEQSLFRCLSVFAGGWTETAANQVCGAEGVPIFDLLDSLVNQSLVSLDIYDTGDPRYSFLETLRDYGRERLEETGKAKQAEQRHADWCLNLAKQAAAATFGPDEDRWLSVLDREQENIRAALERGAAGRIDQRAFIHLVPALGNYWTVRGRFSEARRWLDNAIKTSDGPDYDEDRVPLLNLAGLVAYYQSDMASSLERHLECLALRRHLGDRRGVAGSLNNVGMIHQKTREPESAKRLYLEALETNREIGNLPWQAINLNNLGNLSVEQGWYDDAQGYLEEALRINRELGNRSNTAHAIHNLGHLALQREQIDTAYKLFMEAVDEARELANDRLYTAAQLGAGTAAMKMNRSDEAKERFRDTLQVAIDGGDDDMVSFVLGSLGYLTCLEENWHEAARFYAAAGRLRERVGLPLAPPDEAALDTQLQHIREKIGEEEFTAAWREGERFTDEEAVQHAFVELKKSN